MTREARGSRAASVQLAAAAGLHLAEVAHALGVGPDAARRMGAHHHAA